MLTFRDIKESLGYDAYERVISCYGTEAPVQMWLDGNDETHKIYLKIHQIIHFGDQNASNFLKFLNNSEIQKIKKFPDFEYCTVNYLIRKLYERNDLGLSEKLSKIILDNTNQVGEH